MIGPEFSLGVQVLFISLSLLTVVGLCGMLLVAVAARTIRRIGQ